MFTLYCALLLYLQITWPSYFLLMSFVGMVCQSILLVTITHISHLIFGNNWSVHWGISYLLILFLILKQIANLNVFTPVLNRFYASMFLKIMWIGTASCLYVSLL